MFCIGENPQNLFTGPPTNKQQNKEIGKTNDIWALLLVCFASWLELQDQHKKFCFAMLRAFSSPDPTNVELECPDLNSLAGYFQHWKNYALSKFCLVGKRQHAAAMCKRHWNFSWEMSHPEFVPQKWQGKMFWRPTLPTSMSKSTNSRVGVLSSGRSLQALDKKDNCRFVPEATKACKGNGNRQVWDRCCSNLRRFWLQTSHQDPCFAFILSWPST